MSCPRTPQIRKLLDGKLDGKEHREFAEHLDACQTCQDSLGELCGDDSGQPILDSVSVSDPWQGGSELDRVIGQLKQLASDESARAEPEADEGLRLDFLKPSHSLMKEMQS